MFLQWITFLLYVIVSIYIGWRSRHVAKESFWTAGNGLSSWSVGLSISAGFMSVSWSCVYSTQIFYWYGLGGIWLITVPWVLSLSAIYFLSKHFKKLPSFSQPEMAEKRYGKSGKMIIALALIFVFLVWGGAEIYIAAVLLAHGLNISVPLLIAIIALVVSIYSFYGGFQAVVSTDKLQFVLVAFYIIIVAILGINGFSASGYELNFNVFPAKSNLSWYHLFSPGIILIFSSFIAYLPGWIFETDLWLRIQAAKNNKAAKRGVVIALVNSVIFIGILPLIIGLIALLLYPPVNEVIPQILGNDGDAIFLRIVQDFAPMWLLPLISLGLIAASMSTIDTCTNIVGLSLAHDIFPLIKKKKPSQNINRIFTVGSVFLAMIYAMFTESLWDIFYLSSGILSTTIALPMLGIIWQKLPARPVVYSAWAGFIITIVAYFLEKFKMINQFEPEWIQESGVGYIFWGMAVVVIVFLATHHRRPLRGDFRRWTQIKRR